MPEFTLNIVGNASITKLADEAHLRIATSSSGTDKQDVSDRVLTAAKQIDDMLDEIQDRTENTDPDDKPLSHFSKTSLIANTWVHHVPVTVIQLPEGTGLFGNKPHMQQQQSSTQAVRQYRARIEYDIRFRDFAILGLFSARLTSLNHCDIQSLNWVLLPATQNRYKIELRLAAARDAMTKVRDYCEILFPGKDSRILPVKMGNEQQSGRFQRSTGLAWPSSFDGAGNTNIGTGFGGSNNGAGQGLFGGNNATAGGLFGSSQPQTSGDLFSAASGTAQAAGNAVDQNLSFSPQEISMSLDTEFIFTIETIGHKLSEYKLSREQ